MKRRTFQRLCQQSSKEHHNVYVVLLASEAGNIRGFALRTQTVIHRNLA
jgi:hypothetical protein